MKFVNRRALVAFAMGASLVLACDGGPTAVEPVDQQQVTYVPGTSLRQYLPTDSELAPGSAFFDAAPGATTFGGDWGGADLVPEDGAVLAGEFTNVGTFHVLPGTRVYVLKERALHIVAGTIRIDGTLDGAGRGHPGGALAGQTGAGPGGGTGGRVGPCIHGPGGAGGGYGGTGGSGGLTLTSPAEAAGGPAYGAAAPPGIEFGSGGGSASNHICGYDGRGGAGGPGGASIWLAGDRVSVTGTIVADGMNGKSGTPTMGIYGTGGGGGGSGGGIWLDGALLLSGATLRANGGLGGDFVGNYYTVGGGGGAGGRIKLSGCLAESSDYTAAVAGGAAGASPPISGTVAKHPTNGGAGTFNSSATTCAPTNTAPTANAGGDRTVARTSAAGASVTLDGSGSTDAEGAIASYSWTDGTNVWTGATFTHVFPIGSTTITLTVTDEGGLTATDDVVVVVSNVAPAAHAGPDQSLFRTSAAGASVTLDGTGSSDVDGSLTYAWSVGGVAIASGASAAHVFALGTHEVTLTVTDDVGATHSDVVSITIKNVAPVANAGSNQSLARTSAAGATVSLNGAGSSDLDGSIASYSWSVGGTAIASGATPNHVFGLGTHQVTLEVTDNNGATHSDVVEIEIKNVAPVADAGDDQSVFRTSPAGAAVTLDGLSSSDLDGSISAYQWSENGVVIANGANPTHPFTLGTHTINLEVTDNDGATHNDMMEIIVKNVAPFARAGDNQTLECVSGGASATLDGSASFDLDGTISYLWTTGATTVTTSKIFALGTTTVGLTVTDNNGAQDSDNLDITVRDTRNPSITLSISAPTLWPPNHKMVKVAAGISASDGCDSSLSFAVAVSSNEPVNGTGDGDTGPDWDIVRNANGTYDVWVRAERAGNGNGRIYTITATSTDGSGNTASKTGTVTVAHSQGK